LSWYTTTTGDASRRCQPSTVRTLRQIFPGVQADIAASSLALIARASSHLNSQRFIYRWMWHAFRNN